MPQAPPAPASAQAPIEFDPAQVRPVTPTVAPTTPAAGAPPPFSAAQIRPMTSRTGAPVEFDPATVRPLDTLTGLKKASTIEAVSPMERVEATYPWIGAAAGEMLGGPPGAALGGATGQAVKSLAYTSRTGKVKPPTSLAASVVGQPPVSASPLRAGAQAAAQEAADLAQTAAEQYGVSKGAQAIGRVATGLFRPPPGPDTELMKASEKLGLRLTPPELQGETRLGSISRRVQSATEYSLSGRAEAEVAREVGRENALKGVAQGQEAFRRTGEAFGRVVEQGPAYDMTPHHIDAIRIFGDEIAPKLLDLQGQSLPLPVRTLLQQAANTPGGLSPQLTLRAIRATKVAIQKGAKEPIPIGSLDTLEKVLSTNSTVRFASAAPMRTSFRLIGDKGDALLGDRGTALARHFEDTLTNGMSQAYPPFDPIRKLYAKGAKGLEQPAIEGLVGTAPPEQMAAATAHGQRLPVGQEEDAIENLRYINDALKRSGKTASGATTGWARMYNLFEAVTAGSALYHGGPAEAAGVVGATEVLPGLLSWAAHNPTMTKLLTQGILEKNPTQAAALIGRVYGAYEAQHRETKPMASHVSGQPTAAPTVGQPPPAPAASAARPAAPTTPSSRPTAALQKATGISANPQSLEALSQGYSGEALRGEVPFLPKSPEQLKAVAQTVLQKVGYLGFDTLGQAKSAVLSHPDWAERWNVSGADQQILDRWRTAHLAEHPPQPSVWEDVKAYINEANTARKGREAQATQEAAQMARRSFKVIGQPPPR